MSKNGNVRVEQLSADEFWELLCSKHATLLRQTIGLTQNVTAAEDVVQDALCKAFVKRDSFTPGTNLDAWLWTITRNTHYSTSRKRTRETLVEPEVLQTLAGEDESSIADEDERAYEFEVILCALCALDDVGTDILVLTKYGEYSYDEAARTFSLATGTVKSRISRITERVNTLLASRTVPTHDVESWLANKIYNSHNSNLPQIAKLYEHMLHSYRSIRKRVSADNSLATETTPAEAMFEQDPDLEDFFGNY